MAWWRPGLLLLILILLAWLAVVPAMAQSSDEPVVRAVLLYSPSCPHCLEVMNEVLWPIQEQVGRGTRILMVDVTGGMGRDLYWEAVEHFQIPPERQIVPILIVGEQVLVGEEEIAGQFPTLIEQGLDRDGVGWPELPGLEPFLTGEAASEAREAASEATVAVAEATVAVAALPSDRLGFALGKAVLLFLAGTLVYAVLRLAVLRKGILMALPSTRHSWTAWAVPLLSLAGLGVSLYMSYVEIQQMSPACGPLEGCGVVQSSDYARIFGIPVAFFGVANYLVVWGLWSAASRASPGRAILAAAGLAGLLAGGVLFSIYLTWLELFVIGAVCTWCLSSAAITASLMLLAAAPPKAGRSNGIVERT